MAEELNGADYRALRRLSNKDNDTLADVGQTCELVPTTSLPALLASGKIAHLEHGERAVPAVPQPRKKRTRG